MSDLTPDFVDDNLIDRFRLTLPGNIFSSPLSMDVPVYADINKVTLSPNGSLSVSGNALFMRADNRWVFVYNIKEPV